MSARSSLFCSHVLLNEAVSHNFVLKSIRSLFLSSEYLFYVLYTDARLGATIRACWFVQGQPDVERIVGAAEAAAGEVDCPACGASSSVCLCCAAVRQLICGSARRRTLHTKDIDKPSLSSTGAATPQCPPSPTSHPTKSLMWRYVMPCFGHSGLLCNGQVHQIEGDKFV
jgi:hypothetical protein